MKKSIKHNFVDIPELSMTVKDQERCVRDWEWFLESNLARPQFTKHLYQMLVGHFNYTAHYNQEGFYESYFVE